MELASSSNCVVIELRRHRWNRPPARRRYGGPAGSGWSGESQGRRDSNPQPPVLETGTLPIELRPFVGTAASEVGRELVSGARTQGGESHRGSSVRVARTSGETARPPCRRGWEDAPVTPRISARVGSIAESATLAVDAKAKALKAAGRPVVGFGAGEPDFPTPPAIVEAAVEACRDPRNHRYTPAGGLPELKAAIVEKTRRDSGYVVEPAQVLVTNGGKQAIYEAFATILDPGDEVLLPAPYWTTYPEAIRLA